MTLRFDTTTPNKLLNTFKKLIDDGHVVTWSYDSADDFTHTAKQWENLAWLRPSVKSDRLDFYIVKPKGGSVSWEVYGVYHGRFIESVVVHCHELFQMATATATPTSNDIV